MKKITMVVLMLSLAVCCGCAPQKGADTPLCRVVTQIHITREQGEDTVSRSYADPKSMGAILSYLRRLRPYSLADAMLPECEESCYLITLDYSDGTQHIYQQLGSGFFQDSSGKWRQIDESLGKDLMMLFEQLPDEQSI